MAFYLFDPSGGKYGPADIDVLNEWIVEERLGPKSMLENAETGEVMVAEDVQGLNFNRAYATASDTSTPYGSHVYAAGVGASYPYGEEVQEAWVARYGELILAFVLSVVSPILSLYAIFGLFTSIWGIQASWSSIQKGYRLGILPLVLNIGALGFYIYYRFVMPRS